MPVISDEMIIWRSDDVVDDDDDDKSKYINAQTLDWSTQNLNGIEHWIVISVETM